MDAVGAPALQSGEAVPARELAVACALEAWPSAQAHRDEGRPSTVCSDLRAGPIRERVRPPAAVTRIADVTEPTADLDGEGPRWETARDAGPGPVSTAGRPARRGATTERGEIERPARGCRAADCRAGLNATVVETRFNVVRSLVPDVVTTVRGLSDYLPPVNRHDARARTGIIVDQAAMFGSISSRGGYGHCLVPALTDKD